MPQSIMIDHDYAGHFVIRDFCASNDQGVECVTEDLEICKSLPSLRRK
jgi:hypothetical protein